MPSFQYLKQAIRDDVVGVLRLLRDIERNKGDSNQWLRVRDVQPFFAGKRRSTYDGLEYLVGAGLLHRGTVHYRPNVNANAYWLTRRARQMVIMRYGDYDELPY